VAEITRSSNLQPSAVLICIKASCSYWPWIKNPWGRNFVTLVSRKRIFFFLEFILAAVIDLWWDSELMFVEETHKNQRVLKIYFPWLHYIRFLKKSPQLSLMCDFAGKFLADMTGNFYFSCLWKMINLVLLYRLLWGLLSFFLRIFTIPVWKILLLFSEIFFYLA